MTIQTRSTLSKEESIFSTDDYVITPSSKLHLLTLEGKCIHIKNEGICRIKGFTISNVAKSCGVCLLGKYKTVTVLSKIVIESINSNKTKYIDRNSSNLNKIITNELPDWLMIPNTHSETYSQIAS